MLTAVSGAVKPFAMAGEALHNLPAYPELNLPMPA